MSQIAEGVNKGSGTLNKVIMTMAASALLGGVMMGGAAWAQTVQLSGQMSAAQEVPPKDSKGTGAFTGTYNPATHGLDYSLTYQGLTGPATMAHLHGPAAVGQNAPVEVPFTVSPSPIKGTATLTDAQAADLMAGRLYANVHTGANPGGEIRGQVTHN